MPPPFLPHHNAGHPLTLWPKIKPSLSWFVRNLIIEWEKVPQAPTNPPLSMSCPLPWSALTTGHYPLYLSKEKTSFLTSRSFWKGPESKHLSLGTCGVSCIYSSLSLSHGNSHRTNGCSCVPVYKKLRDRQMCSMSCGLLILTLNPWPLSLVENITPATTSPPR